MFSVSQSTNQMTFFCKEGNKLVGSTKILAWKKRFDLILMENEDMEYVLDEVTQPDKEKNKELEIYNKGEVRAQRIIIESIKYHLAPIVFYLISYKDIYDKLV